MNYTFKLSRRLARFRAASVLAASLLTLSCAADGPNGPGSSPDPTRVSISPESVTLGVNQTTQFEASMDSSASPLLSSSYRYKGRGRNSVVDLTIKPHSYTLAEGSAAGFTAVGTRRDGSLSAPSVTWTATGGIIDASGKYTAGPVAGNYSVSAKASNGVADTAIVIVAETTPTVTNISLSPTSTSLPAGGSKQFTVVGTASDGATVPVSPKYAATGGTVSSTGMYEAGQTPGAYRIVATDTVSSVADTSAVTITALGVTLQSVVLVPATASVAQGAKQQFSASGKMSDGTTVPISPSFAATGGSISSSGEYTAGSTAGTYRVIAADAVSGKADTSAVTITASPATLQAVVLTPSSASITTGGTKQFAASGAMSDGSTVPLSPLFTATGGTISSSGEYTAGGTEGSYRVIAKDETSGKADTSSVTITATSPPPPSPTLQSIVLTPTSASVVAGATQQFTASGKMSDGSTSAVTVTWSAAGGTISSAGLYTAGQTAGTFRAIATQSGGTLADTAVVTVTASTPPPPPSSGTTFFQADAEGGSMSPWSLPWGVIGNPPPTNSTARARTGTRSYQYEVPSAQAAVDVHYTQTLSGGPQTSMGSSRYRSGYYSWWTYIDAGFTTANAWNMQLGWMTGVGGAPSPICFLGLEVRNGVLQRVFVAQNHVNGQAPAPDIANYTRNGGWYFQTASSPNGITPFPSGQWVHTSVYYKSSSTNGQVTVWQDGVKIMDLTNAQLDTWGGYDRTNAAGDMILQFGIYGGPQTGTQRFYMDDFKVTDYRVTP